MVRTVNIKGKEYYVITTFLEADGIEAPVQIHISLSHLNIEKKEKIKNLEYVKSYYGYSTEKAEQALRILSDEQINFIKQKLDVGGTK